MIKLTMYEEQLYMMAYTTNQPQPHNPRTPGNSERVMRPKYWAACAVLAMRGETTTPTPQYVEDMFLYMQRVVCGILQQETNK